MSDLATGVDILVVDDNPNQLATLHAILAELGANVVCVRSGRDALRCLLNRDFAAILLDVNMPIMDGFETARFIRQRLRSEHTPIIFVTAYGDEIHEARGYSLGAVDYITTPVIPEVLRAKIAVFIELFRTSTKVRRQADSLRRRAEQLRALTDASIAIHQRSSMDELVPIVAERARAIVGARFAAVRLRLDHRPYAAEASVTGSAPSSMPSAFADTMAHAAATGAPVHAAAAKTAERAPAAVAETAERVQAAGVQNDGATPTIDQQDDTGGANGGCLAVPLTARDGRNIGVVLVAGKVDGTFDGEDTAILLQLGQMASIAAENTLYGEEREANRLKDEFLATVSHELRTPLTAMLSWIRLLQDGLLDDRERGRGLEVIERNARAQSRLIDDLLDTSRIVTGKLQIAREPVAVEPVVSDAVESLRPAAAAKGIDVRIAVDNCGTVVGEAKRLQQVLWNLLSNAVKFTPRGGRVDVVARRDGDELELRVSDTGPGISPAFLPHVFDRFRQADTSTTRAHGGLGLGLAIVRHLVELHGGTVRAESDGDQRGATFIVRLPLAPAPRVESASVIVGADGVGPNGVGADDGRAAIVLDGLRVLVVEDDGDGREAIAMLLTTAGADVIAVESAQAALAAMSDGVPHVLVSDIGLPLEDGYVLIQKVRQLDAAHGGAVPAIALTAYTRPQDRARALAAGYQAHVCKPVDPLELLSALAVHIPRSINVASSAGGR